MVSARQATSLGNSGPRAAALSTASPRSRAFAASVPRRVCCHAAAASMAGSLSRDTLTCGRCAPDDQGTGTGCRFLSASQYRPMKRDRVTASTPSLAQRADNVLRTVAVSPRASSRSAAADSTRGRVRGGQQLGEPDVPRVGSGPPVDRGHLQQHVGADLLGSSGSRSARSSSSAASAWRPRNCSAWAARRNTPHTHGSSNGGVVSSSVASLSSSGAARCAERAASTCSRRRSSLSISASTAAVRSVRRSPGGSSKPTRPSTRRTRRALAWSFSSRPTILATCSTGISPWHTTSPRSSASGPGGSRAADSAASSERAVTIRWANAVSTEGRVTFGFPGSGPRHRRISPGLPWLSRVARSQASLEASVPGSPAASHIAWNAEASNGPSSSSSPPPAGRVPI